MMSDAVFTKDKVRKKPGTRNYFIGMAVFTCLLYFFNNMRFLDLSFVNNEDFTSCLWAINLAMGFGIVGNFTLLLYRPRWFHHLVQAIIMGLLIFAVFTVYRIFPFSFDDMTLASNVRRALGALMGALGVLAIIEIVKLALALTNRKR